MDKHFKNMRLRIGYILTISVLLAVVTACGGSNQQTVSALNCPSDNILTLYCPNVGIASEDCILDDPENIFAGTDVGDHNKFELHTDTAQIPKCNFYLWGTAQARSPRGENQYYTALALHKLYGLGSKLAKNQAIKAYFSVLDNYFESVTFFGDFDPRFPVRLRELAAQKLYSRDDLSENFKALFSNEQEAFAAFGDEGYTYTPPIDPANPHDRGRVTINR